MMASSLSRAAAAVRVVFVLCILSLAVAADAAHSRPPPPQLPRTVIQRKEHGARAIPPHVPSLSILPLGRDVPTTDTDPTAFEIPLTFTIPTPIVMSQQVTIGFTWPYRPTPIFLCQTLATTASELTADNTWLVLNINFPALNTSTQHRGGEPVPVSMTFEIPPNPPPDSTYNNFFFCWGTSLADTAFSCLNYSQSFDVTPAAQKALVRNRNTIESVPREAHLQPRFVGTPTTSLQIFHSTAVLSILNYPAPTPPPPVEQKSITTVIGPETTLTFPPSTPTASGTVVAATGNSSGLKLGIGPIVGIAIGGVIVLLLLVLFAVVCIRRRRRSDHEAQHTLLHNGSGGSRDVTQDLQMEKNHRASVIPSAPMLSFLETRPASGPFDHLELSEPYSGPAAPILRSRPPSSAPPMASTAPTSAAVTVAAAAADTATAVVASTDSQVVPENMSEVSAPLSPRSTVRSVSAYSVPYSVPYSDNPTYGDARHTPQLYESPSQTPFLSEPGMSAEELSRLEEEERRIDAAIAEAEAARR